MKSKIVEVSWVGLSGCEASVDPENLADLTVESIGMIASVWLSKGNGPKFEASDSELLCFTCVSSFKML